MTETSTSREAILSRVQSSHAATTSEQVSSVYAKIPRSYIRTGSLNSEQMLDMFEERLMEYDAKVHRVTESSLPKAIAEALRARGAKQIAIPAGISTAWLPPDFPFTEADGLSNLELDEFDGIVSGCTVAIALTGTIVLQNAPGQGPRKLSLIPDYHLCVVLAGQIVETVSEAFDRLIATATLPTTFISGPSATGDIEMTRIKGVHGPRFLEVVIVS